MLEIRKNLGCLYSANHVGRFFRLAVAHTIATPTRPFDFVLASRQGNKVQADLEQHFTRFLRLGQKHCVNIEILLNMVALSILLDAYPPKMHSKCFAIYNYLCTYILLFQISTRMSCIFSLSPTCFMRSRWYVREPKQYLPPRLYYTTLYGQTLDGDVRIQKIGFRSPSGDHCFSEARLDANNLQQNLFMLPLKSSQRCSFLRTCYVRCVCPQHWTRDDFAR